MGSRGKFMDISFVFDKSGFARTAFRTILFVSVACAFSMRFEEALAHPHVFIVQRLDVVFDDKGLTGFKVRWIFDEMFAGMIAEDFDKNRNGALESSEVEEVKQKAFSYIAEFDYFCFVKIDKKPFKVQYVKDFKATLKNGRLTYEFLVPCHVTATNAAKKITFATYDPTYYTAVFFAENEPVSLASAENYEVKVSIREDEETKIYFDMLSPWALFLEFRRKP